MSESLLNRIYDVKIAGYDDSIQKVKALTDAFDKMDAAKKKLNEQLQKKLDAGDTASIQALSAKIKELEEKLKTLSKQKEASAKETLLMAKADTEAAKATAIRTKSIIEENKEVDRKNSLDEKKIKQQEKEQISTEKLSSAYLQLNARYKVQSSIALEMGARYGSTSEQFKMAAERARLLNTELMAIESGVGKNQRNVGNYSSALNSVNQVLREAPAFANSAQTGFMAISNNLPILADEFQKLRKETGSGFQAFKILSGGLFGFNAIMTLCITLTTVYGKEIGAFISNLFKSKEAIDKLKESQVQLNKALESTEYKNAIVQVKELQANIKLAKEGFLDKEKVLYQYNETIGKTTGEVKTLEEAEKSLQKNADAYIKMTLYKAAAQLALEEAAKKSLEAEKLRIKKEEEFKNTFVDTRINAGGIGMGGGSFNASEYEAESKRIKVAQEKRKADEVKVAQDAADSQESIAKDFQKKAAEIAKGNKFDFFGGKENDKNKDNASKLSNSEKDALKEIESKRRLELALEEARVAETKSSRKLTYEEEENYITKIQSINVKYLNQKIDFLSKQKQLNAEEKITLAGFRKEKADSELKAQDEFAGIRKREFDLQKKLLEQSFNSAKAQAEEEQNKVSDKPDSTLTDRLLAKYKYYDALYLLQLNFNESISKLSTTFKQDNILEEKKDNEALLDIDREQSRLRLQIGEAYLKDKLKQSNEEAAIKLDKNKVQTADKVIEIITSKQLNSSRKAYALKQLEIEQTKKQLEIEVQALIDAAQLKKELFEKGFITEKEYLDAVTELREKQAARVKYLDQLDLNAGKEKVTSLKDLLQKGLRNLFNFGKGTEGDKLLNDTLANAFDFAKQTMNDYFDAKQARVERDKQQTYERIDLEKQQLLSAAQSTAEKETIERRAAAKKKEADRLAFEENKKIQKAQAQINLATQLSNLAVIAFAPNPANIATLGIAGAIMYAVQAGLAIAGYAANINRINAAKFATGGKVVPMFADGGVADVGNGMITTSPNIPTQSNGDNIFATVKTGEVILNEDQQRRAGGASFFKALGVPGFASGGYTGLGNFKLGDSLQAPYNPSSFLNRNNSISEDFSKIYEAIDKQTENINSLASQTNKRIDNIKVQVVAKEVETTNNQTKKAEAIGTL